MKLVILLYEAGLLLPSFCLEDQSLPISCDPRWNGPFSIPFLSRLPSSSSSSLLLPPPMLSSPLCLFFGHAFQRSSPPHPHEFLASSLKGEPRTATQTITQSCNRCSSFTWGWRNFLPSLVCLPHMCPSTCHSSCDRPLNLYSVSVSTYIRECVCHRASLMTLYTAAGGGGGD